MDKTILDMAVDRVVKLNMKVIDLYYDEFIKPVVDEVRNPEKVIGKKYEDWTPMDVQMLKSVYGENSEVFNNFIFKKELASVKALEEA